MMTLDEARAHPGAEVTHQATGVIELVTAQFVWVRYQRRGDSAGRPARRTHPRRGCGRACRDHPGT